LGVAFITLDLNVLVQKPAKKNKNLMADQLKFIKLFEDKLEFKTLEQFPSTIPLGAGIDTRLDKRDV
jgi:hypothetical protein